MLYSPSLPPSLFSLASSACSHSIPLPTEAESRSSGIAAQPTQEPILAGAGPEPLHRHCPGRELLSKVWLMAVPSRHRSSHFPSVHRWGCWCYPWCMDPHGVSPQPTLTPWWHLWVIAEQSIAGALVKTAGHGMGQQCPLKPLRFMHALKCFAKSTPPHWGWNSSH